MINVYLAPKDNLYLKGNLNLASNLSDSSDFHKGNCYLKGNLIRARYLSGSFLFLINVYLAPKDNLYLKGNLNLSDSSDFHKGNCYLKGNLTHARYLSSDFRLMFIWPPNITFTLNLTLNLLVTFAHNIQEEM